LHHLAGLSVTLLVAIAIFALVCRLLKVEELTKLSQMVVNRFKR
jgi:hypothetical protein